MSNKALGTDHFSVRPDEYKDINYLMKYLKKVLRKGLNKDKGKTKVGSFLNPTLVRAALDDITEEIFYQRTIYEMATPISGEFFVDAVDGSEFIKKAHDIFDPYHHSTKNLQRQEIKFLAKKALNEPTPRKKVEVYSLGEDMGISSVFNCYLIPEVDPTRLTENQIIFQYEFVHKREEIINHTVLDKFCLTENQIVNFSRKYSGKLKKRKHDWMWFLNKNVKYNSYRLYIIEINSISDLRCTPCALDGGGKRGCGTWDYGRDVLITSEPLYKLTQ